MVVNFPTKKYKIIYADPPWNYKDKALAGKRGASCKYETQSNKWIEELPVREISDDDCFLFLWITMPKLKEGLPVIEKWGFEYKTCAFTWVKRYRKCKKWFIGMGNWTRANAELCVLGIKGKPKRVSASVRSVVDCPIGKKHSEKPDVVRDRIVELCGDIPRIELFATKRTDGWDVWGDEV